MSVKRQRQDNFDVADVELLLGLVNENTDLIDSTKLEAKKQGWDTICTKFNANCIGVKRDLSALKMKVKNMKAASKRSKLEFEVQDPLAAATENHSKRKSSLNDNESMTENDQEYEDQQHATGGSSLESSSATKLRKRCKKFSKPECDLLLALYDKHCNNLDSSSSFNSVKKRTEAWEALTEEYNRKEPTGVKRDCAELKIKIKNIKAMRVKTEPDDRSIMDNSSTFNNSNASITKNNDEHKLLQPRPIGTLQQIQPQPPTTQQNFEINNFYDEDEEDDYPLNQLNINSTINSKPPMTSDDREIEKVRRENVLLKNAVLRKKERLLELQIALAERNLRRQI